MKAVFYLYVWNWKQQPFFLLLLIFHAGSDAQRKAHNQTAPTTRSKCAQAENADLCEARHWRHMLMPFFRQFVVRWVPEPWAPTTSAMPLILQNAIELDLLVGYKKCRRQKLHLLRSSCLQLLTSKVAKINLPLADSIHPSVLGHNIILD